MKPGPAVVLQRQKAVGQARALAAALAELTGQRRAVPCSTDPAAWFSDDADDRAAAVEACGFCPVRNECRSYSVAAREPYGVWAGFDRTPEPRGETARRTPRVKPCTVCGAVLPLEGFAMDRSPRAAGTAAGRKAACLECDRTRSRTYYLTHRRAVLARQAAAYAAKTSPPRETINPEHQEAS